PPARTWRRRICADAASSVGAIATSLLRLPASLPRLIRRRQPHTPSYETTSETPRPPGRMVEKRSKRLMLDECGSKWYKLQTDECQRLAHYSREGPHDGPAPARLLLLLAI